MLIEVRRNKYFLLKQGPQPNIYEYVAELKTQASFSEFGFSVDKYILDQFLVGLNNSLYQIQLLTVPNLTVNLAIITVLYWIGAQKEVYHTKDSKYDYTSKQVRENNTILHINTNTGYNNAFICTSNCMRCGLRHKIPHKCPAWNSIYRICGRK